jgi:hypothetical protein
VEKARAIADACARGIRPLVDVAVVCAHAMFRAVKAAEESTKEDLSALIFILSLKKRTQRCVTDLARQGARGFLGAAGVEKRSGEGGLSGGMGESR